MTAAFARRSPAAVVVALATVYVVWGSTYLAIRITDRTQPPLLMSSIRFLIAGLLLYAIAARGGPRPTWREWRAAAVVGAALLLVGNGGVAWAETRINSGLAALLVAMMPLWMALLDRIVFGRRLAPAAGLGLVVGLGGVAVLVGPGGGGTDLVGALACVLAALSWAAGSLYARHAAMPENSQTGAGMEMLAAGVLLAVVGVAAGEIGQFHPGAVSAESLLALAYLVVFGSIVAFNAYIWILKAAPTSIVSTYAYVNPVVAVLLGAAFLSEPITARTLLAGLAIVASVALIVTAQTARRHAEPEPIRLPEPAEEGATLAA